MGVPVREPVIVPWTVDCVPVVPASLDPLFVASYPVLSTPAARRLIHVYICFPTGTTPAILRFVALSMAVPLVVIICQFVSLSVFDSPIRLWCLLFLVNK